MLFFLSKYGNTSHLTSQKAKKQGVAHTVISTLTWQGSSPA